MIDLDTFKNLLANRRKSESRLVYASAPLAEGTHESAPRSSKQKSRSKQRKSQGNSTRVKAVQATDQSQALKPAKRSRTELLTEREQLCAMREQAALVSSGHQEKLHQVHERLEQLNDEKHDLVIKLKQALQQEGTLKRQASNAAFLTSPTALTSPTMFTTSSRDPFSSAPVSGVQAMPGPEACTSEMLASQQNLSRDPSVADAQSPRDWRPASEQVSSLNAGLAMLATPEAAVDPSGMEQLPPSPCKTASPQQPRLHAARGAPPNAIASRGEDGDGEDGEVLEEGEVAPSPPSGSSPRWWNGAFPAQEGQGELGGSGWLPPHLQTQSGLHGSRPTSPTQLPPHMKPQGAAGLLHPPGRNLGMQGGGLVGMGRSRHGPGPAPGRWGGRGGRGWVHAQGPGVPGQQHGRRGGYPY